MASKKGGLGKGLESLFSENAILDEGSTVKLSINDIEPNRDQPRKEFDEQALSELADSIAQHGVLQPLLVRPILDGGYQLVAGERRWRAARMAGLTEVPVVIRSMSDREMMELAMIENLQREDLNPVEEAEGFRQLMEMYDLTQEDVAKAVGKSRPAVANAMRLLGLPSDVLGLVRSGSLSSGHARCLLSFPTEQVHEVAQEVLKKNLTVRDLEKMAKAVHRKPRAAAEKPRRAPFFDEVELALKTQLGRRVRVVNASGDTGTLEIEFYDRDDLRDLAGKLGGDA